MSMLDAITERFLAGFPEEPRTWRQVGREAEHPIVRKDGTAGDVAVLWEHLARTGDFEVLREGALTIGLQSESLTYSSEVGTGTMEVIVGPRQDLHGIREDYERGMAGLLEACAAHDLHVLGYGIQPVTAPTLPLMTGKRRYGVLHEVLGDAWLWFTVTASDQTHVEVSRHEVITATNVLNLLSPLVVGLFGNSPIHSNRDAEVCSGREAMMGRIHADGARHGMPKQPATDAADWVRRTFALDYLMHRDADGLHAGEGSFGDFLRTTDLDPAAVFAAWELHDHYIWNSARPRCRHGTLEQRAPCQQPWDSHMAPAALAVGVVSAHTQIEAYLRDLLGQDTWPAMRIWHHDVVRQGLVAPAPRGELVQDVLQIARKALVERDRGEEVYLEPLFERARSRRNPGQIAADAWRVGGIDALLDAVVIR